MRVLIVGLGSIGQRHLRNLRQISGNKIEIIAYRSVGRNLIIDDAMVAKPCDDLAEAYNIKTFTDYSEALEQKPDAVFITCPTSLHIPMALEAAKHNCHLFIEKPLSDTMEGVEELIKVVKERNLITLVGYQMRFHPSLRTIRDLMWEGAIGKVLSAYCEFGEYLPYAHPYEDYREGYAARKDLGGGVLLCLSHEIDYMQWLFGMPRRVFAVGGKVSDLQIDVEDTADILMECSIPVHIHLDFMQCPRTRRFRIIGSAGRDIAKRYPLFHIDRSRLFRDEIRHFISCINELETPVVDIEEGLKSLKIALAAKRSIELGTVEVMQ